MIRIVTDESCTGYEQPGHPERPERIASTLKYLRNQTELKLTWSKPAAAEDESLLLAHTPAHLDRLEEPYPFDGDTPYYPGIPNYARLSAGAALLALESARKGETVFSLMRPPGHHAERNRAMGFCYLNNVAIAALQALQTGAKRVAVFDFDVHHGNGTEAILLNNPKAVFYSIHQYPCYPGTGGRNVGTNCFNFPVPPQTPRGDYRHVIEGALEHLLIFKPEFIFVSAGFDAYARDPLAQETLEDEDFLWIGEGLRKTSIPLVSLLEGGYSDDLPALIFAYLKGISA